MSRNLYVSDTHFGHKNILRYDNRPFFDTDEMERTMIRIWNERVEGGDHVYVLGDFCWSGKVEEWKRIIDQLTGYIHLIRGNHDFSKEHFKGKDILLDEDLWESRFVEVTDYLEVDDILAGHKVRVAMCHYPMPFYRNSFNEDMYMLYGHVHNTHGEDALEELKVKLKRDIKNLKKLGYEDRVAFYNKAQFYNVGCMMPYMGYGPQPLEEIVGVQKA